ncbi:hypothetical protein [Persicobacter diffluens]|uniref:Uncharacterized protein n=1 Tax=Persicobacter diffluens TaxID=981 RepID=A0AAN5AJP7_9BACT|nr:hypothetical protein PEDI_24220 [Persicobacter diffluens]
MYYFFVDLNQDQAMGAQYTWWLKEHDQGANTCIQTTRMALIGVFSSPSPK